MAKNLFKNGNWKTMGIGVLAGSVVAGAVAAIIGAIVSKKDPEIVDYTVEEDETANESTDSEA